MFKNKKKQFEKSFLFDVHHNGLFVRENRLNKQRRIEKTTIEASQPPNTSPT